MKLKLVLIVLGILILTQFVAYGRIQSGNVTMIRSDMERLDGEISRYESELAAQTRERDRLLAMVATIPPEILTGFDDPETEFVEFLDYLNDPAVRRVDGKFSLRQAPRYGASPIPLHESQFNLQFSFLRPGEAEEFFNFLFKQQRFPVQLSTLRLSGAAASRVQGDLAFTFKVPARLKQPLPTLPIVAEKQ